MARPVKSGLLHLIVINANTTGVTGRTVVGGNATSDSIYEAYTYSNGIIKQETSRGYFVQTQDGKGRVRLVATDSLGKGQAFIKATDSRGNTYFVTKLTAHKATLVQWTWADNGDWEHATGTTAEWTFGDTSDGKVSIENDA